MDDEHCDGESGEGRVLAIHAGRSANCSSIGSYVDFLFLSAAASGVLLGALAVALTPAAEAGADRAPPDGSAPTPPERDGDG